MQSFMFFSIFKRYACAIFPTQYQYNIYQNPLAELN